MALGIGNLDYFRDELREINEKKGVSYVNTVIILLNLAKDNNTPNKHHYFTTISLHSLSSVLQITKISLQPSFQS